MAAIPFCNRITARVIVLSAITFASVISLRAASALQRAISSPGRIQNGYASGAITRNQRAEYFAYSMFDRARLPDVYQSAAPEKCATWMLDIIHEDWNSLDSATHNILEGYGFRTAGVLSRPTVNLPSAFSTSISASTIRFPEGTRTPLRLPTATTTARPITLTESPHRLSMCGMWR
jgi:hypothetical protein